MMSRRRVLRQLEVFVTMSVGVSLIYVTFYTHRKIQHLQEEKLQPFTPFMIISYPQGGGSTLGDIMQQHPDSFYVNEPLEPLNKVFEGENTIVNLELLNGTFMSLRKEQYFTRSTMVIASYLLCHFNDMDTLTLLNNYLGKATKTSKFSKCLKEREDTLNLHGNIELCLDILKSHCESSKFRFVKSSQVPTALYSSFLKVIPKMKIIHLLRDPRAIITAEEQIQHSTKLDNEQKYARNLCKKMNDDVEDLQQLASTYNSKIMSVYYEDLATRPLEIAKMIYNFIGMDFNLEIEAAIKSITFHDKLNVMAWRTNITESRGYVIDLECEEFYKNTGYVPSAYQVDKNKPLWPQNRTGINLHL